MTLRAPSFLRIVGVAGVLAIVAGPESSMAQVGTTTDKGAPVDRALVDSGIKLTANDAAPYDGFGAAVAISGDTVVVGAPSDDDAGTASGSAYVFVRSGGTWREQQKLTASDANARDVFGGAVAINGDAIVVGACHSVYPFFSSGAAYVFVRSGGVWSQQQKLTAGDAAPYDAFGCSVAVSGNTVVVGAPAFNMSAPRYPPGSAYVFDRIGSLWIQEAKLNASDAVNGDFFGFSVAISGNTVVVGAPFGDSAAAANSGSAYVFEPAGSLWIQKAKLTPNDAAFFDLFGDSVAISGGAIVVGAPWDDDAGNASGSAYTFLRSGVVWNQDQKLTANDANVLDQFGTSVAISGNTVVVGAPFGDSAAASDSGSVYVFKPVRSPSIQESKLTANDAAFLDRFGASVAISGDLVAAGAPGADTPNASHAGGVYLASFGEH